MTYVGLILEPFESTAVWLVMEQVLRGESLTSLERDVLRRHQAKLEAAMVSVRAAHYGPNGVLEWDYSDTREANVDQQAETDSP